MNVITNTHAHTHTYMDVTADAVPDALALVHGARWHHASRRVGGEGPRCPEGTANPLDWPASYRMSYARVLVKLAASYLYLNTRATCTEYEGHTLIFALTIRMISLVSGGRF